MYWLPGFLCKCLLYSYVCDSGTAGIWCLLQTLTLSKQQYGVYCKYLPYRNSSMVSIANAYPIETAVWYILQILTLSKQQYGVYCKYLPYRNSSMVSIANTYPIETAVWCILQILTLSKQRFSLPFYVLILLILVIFLFVFISFNFYALFLFFLLSWLWFSVLCHLRNTLTFYLYTIAFGSACLTWL